MEYRYGQDGVERVVEILRDELVMCMGLMGTPTIGDILYLVF